MAESDAQDKTEEATEKRLQESREKGSVVRSKDLGIFVVLFGGSLCLKLLGSQMVTALTTLSQRCWTLPKDVIFDVNQLALIGHGALTDLVWLLLPWFTAIICLAIGGHLCIGGFVFSVEQFFFKFSRLDPLAGLQKIFSTKTLIELAKSILKFGLLSGAFAVFVISFLPEISHLDEQDLKLGIFRSAELMFNNLLLLGIVLAVVVALDVPYQLYDHMQQLKMTKQEVKEEMKDTEGNPEMKSRLKSMQNTLAKNRMMQSLPEADVVITNPTHFAVALKYDQETNQSPVVIAKGVDKIAELIRQRCTDHRIPIVSAPPLARSLYYHVELEQPIPPGLFLAVAKVLAYVFELKMYQQGHSKQYPILPSITEIPEDLAK